MEQAVANSFSEFEGWINNNLRHEDEDYEVYRVVENLVKHGGFDPSTMKDEDVIALVTPLLQKLVLSYLDGAREIWRVSS